ncbi:hypothetical protein K439DRAFT_369019 [Ramaria rubella]|nr:hypothetical protein K439DRAFT_369019 [Ramaria rubella]
MDICAPMITLYPGYARRRGRGLDRLSSEPPRRSLSPVEDSRCEPKTKNIKGLNNWDPTFIHCLISSVS